MKKKNSKRSNENRKRYQSLIELETCGKWSSVKRVGCHGGGCEYAKRIERVEKVAKSVNSEVKSVKERINSSLLALPSVLFWFLTLSTFQLGPIFRLKWSFRLLFESYLSPNLLGQNIYQDKWSPSKSLTLLVLLRSVPWEDIYTVIEFQMQSHKIYN